MNKKSVRMYMMAVLSYYRAEWTDVADDDTDYRLAVGRELERIIRDCMRRKTSIPNAAKEVEIFFDLQSQKTGLPIGRDIKSSTSGQGEKDAPDATPEGDGTVA